MKTHTSIEALETRIAPAVLFAVEVGTNKLVSFDSAAPGTLLSDVTITGLDAGEIVSGIDFAPATGRLMALGIVDDGATRTATIYTLDLATGAATQAFTFTSSNQADTGSFGFDINPVSTNAHFVNNLDGNTVLNNMSITNGTALDDPAQIEIITAIAFDRPFGGTKTTLYGYNFSTDQLVTIGDVDGSPDASTSGIVKPIAKATLGGVNFNSSNGAAISFDIGGAFGGADVGWMAMRTGASATVNLYNIDLATAALTDLGAVGDGTRLFSGLSVQTDAAAPAISADQKTATWTDLDGDAVTLKITKGTLTAANFRMLAGAGTTSALSKLTLTDAAFAGTNVTFSAKPGASGGDGRVNVGTINATGVDLGNVTIPGDLIVIDAGNAAAPAPSVKSLTIGSMAAFGTALVGNVFDFQSSLADGAGKITIAGDFAGRLDTGLSKTGSLTIGGNIRDAGRSFSGEIAHFGGGSIGKLVIKGSVLGGEFGNSARVLLGSVGSVFIGGSIVGGDIDATGRVSITGGKNSTFTIGGSLIGGAGQDTGSAQPGAGFISVKIGGSLIGDGGDRSGALSIRGNASVTIGGDVRGGAGEDSASITDFFGQQASLKSLTIGGSVTSGDKALNIAAKRIGALTIKGSVTGTTTAPVNITAEGIAAPATAAESVALGQVTIGGNVTFASILTGLKKDLAANTPDAAIGAVKIGGNFIASNIAAGIDAVNGKLGDTDDAFIGGNAGNAAIVAKIASITIGGQLIGTAGGAADRFGIIAEQIGSITVGKTKLPLTTGKDDLTVGFTSDIRIREL